MDLGCPTSHSCAEPCGRTSRYYSRADGRTGGEGTLVLVGMSQLDCLFGDLKRSNPLALDANYSIFTSRSPRLRTFSEKGTGFPVLSQPCSTLELAVTCRCAWACLITFEPGIFAKVSAAFRAAAERPIRVSRLSRTDGIIGGGNAAGYW
jgi:hypothetical protein